MSVAALPPVVVKTVPQAGDTKVDPVVERNPGHFQQEDDQRKLVLGRGR